ncbi:MAG: DUF2173 family protein [Gammaproteobacteria bacterium]
MAELSRLMDLRGAVAAWEFTPVGEIISYKGDLSEESLRPISKLCALSMLSFVAAMRPSLAVR